jgi:hypothetical protein
MLELIAGLGCFGVVLAFLGIVGVCIAAFWMFVKWLLVI